tara:strand:- start:682 stop:1005 length:324 start_codon:yes stop_codon:yes gene_type:complete
MNRYQNISISVGVNQAGESKRGYANVKYPEIPRDFSDTYVYTNRGDRYDTLAFQYYDDASLWWIITRANSNQTPDSLIPNIGSQLRIPGNERIPNIIASYKSINNIR